MATEVSIDISKTKLGEALSPNWLRIKGFGALVSPENPTVVNYIESPYAEDVYIIRAFLHVRTASGNVATDLDIGLADDAAGTNIGGELADGMVAATLNAVGVKELGIVHAIATPPVKPCWKAKGSAADSFLATIQNGKVDASALVYDLYLEIVRAKDLN